MLIKNEEIITITEKLYNNIVNNNSLKFPTKINYIITKNYNNLFNIYNELLKVKENICKDYCTKMVEDGKFLFETKESQENVQKELNDLLNLKQEVNILTFNLDILNNIELSVKEMDSLMIMIEE